MNLLINVKDWAQNNLISILAVLVLCVALVGIGQFLVSSVLPTLEARSKLEAQLVDARNTLVDVRRSQSEPLANTQSKLFNAQSKLDSTLGYFLSESQANEFINSLYDWASASNVKITRVETTISVIQPTPTRVPATPTRPVPTLIPTSGTARPSTPAPTPGFSPTPQATATKSMSPTPQPTLGAKDDVSARIVRVQAQGVSQQLIQFISRIKDVNSKAIFVNGVAISGEDKGLLNLELVLYLAPSAVSSGSGAATSQSSTGSKAAAAPIVPTGAPTDIPLPSSTFTVIPSPTRSATLQPTSVPFQRYTIHVTVQGETMATIARQYGTTVELIRAANRRSSDDVRPGQQLLIPTR